MRLSNKDVGRLRRYLTENEVSRLMEATEQNEFALRDRTLILAAYRHGLRVSELIDLRWDQDVDLDSARLLVRRLKNGRDGVHRLREDEVMLLKDLKAKHPDESFVFPSGRGGKMARCNVNRMLATAGKRAGLPNVTPHQLRHACGYELAMRGTDTRRLQVYLGHRSILSTVVYTDLAMHATDSIWGS